MQSWTVFANCDLFSPGAALLLKRNGHTARSVADGDQLVIEYAKASGTIGSVTKAGDGWAIFSVEGENWRVAQEAAEYWTVLGRA